MALLAGPFIVSAALLAGGGAVKVVRPAPTARALTEMGLPVPSTVVRLGAAAELAVATGALLGAGRVFALLVAVSYVGFAGFVLAALRRGVPLSSCGCFGARDTPPTAVHLVLNLAAAAVAGVVALGGAGGGGLREVAALEGSFLVAGAFVASTAAAVWLAYVALTLLPRVRTVAST